MDISTENQNPVAIWLKAANREQRERLAFLAGTKVSYLYQLAGGHRSVPRADLAFRLEDASLILHKESKGKLPKLSARALSDMAAISQLPCDNA